MEEGVEEVGEGGSMKVLLACRRLRHFRAVQAQVRRIGSGEIGIDQKTADLLDVRPGDTVLAVAR